MSPLERPTLKSLPGLSSMTRHVHFPPTPGMVSATVTVPIHSPTSCDRAPIVVSPNSCALPERGGRVVSDYFGMEVKASSGKKPGLKRRKTGAKSGAGFSEPGLDGCLAGF